MRKYKAEIFTRVLQTPMTDKMYTDLIRCRKPRETTPEMIRGVLERWLTRRKAGVGKDKYHG